jgi:hypothetical protein
VLKPFLVFAKTEIFIAEFMLFAKLGGGQTTFRLLLKE